MLCLLRRYNWHNFLFCHKNKTLTARDFAERTKNYSVLAPTHLADSVLQRPNQSLRSWPGSSPPFRSSSAPWFQDEHWERGWRCPTAPGTLPQQLRSSGFLRKSRGRSPRPPASRWRMRCLERPRAWCTKFGALADASPATNGWTDHRGLSGRRSSFQNSLAQTWTWNLWSRLFWSLNPRVQSVCTCRTASASGERTAWTALPKRSAPCVESE